MIILLFFERWDRNTKGVLDAFVSNLCALHDFKNKKIQEQVLFI